MHADTLERANAIHALCFESASINNLSSWVNDPRTAFTHNCRA
jgi:hypothetical protein